MTEEDGSTYIYLREGAAYSTIRTSFLAFSTFLHIVGYSKTTSRSCEWEC